MEENRKSGYLVFDVETANDDSGSICQIGMVFLDNEFNEIEPKRFSALIDPQDCFEYNHHTKIHRIDENTIANAVPHPDTFDKFWNNHKEDFYNNMLVFHSNSNFDYRCIKASTERYGIDFDESKISFIDTQKWVTNVTNAEYKPYKLPFICGKLELQVLSHHDATNDAIMCMHLFKWLNEQDPEKNRLTAASRSGLLGHKFKNSALSANQTRISELYKMLGEFIENSNASQEEFIKLNERISCFSDLNGLYPYEETKKVFSEFSIINDDNKDELINRIYEIIDIKTKEDFFEPQDTDIDFKGKSFLITNEFHLGKRDELKSRITELGGNPNGNAKADYLIVGGINTTSNKFLYYNDKMIKAYENKKYKKKGNKILDEITFVNNLKKHEKQDL